MSYSATVLIIINMAKFQSCQQNLKSLQTNETQELEVLSMELPIGKGEMMTYNI